MSKFPIQIRVDAGDLTRWQAAATAADQSLSEWIRERCNLADPISDRASAPAKNTPTQSARLVVA